MPVVELDDGYWREHGCYLHLWASGNCCAGKYVYVWADWSTKTESRLSYRILQNAAEVVPWTLFVDVEAVFAKTKFVQEEDSWYDSVAPIGGAELLPEGIYRLEVRTLLGQQEYVFNGPSIVVGPEDELLGSGSDPATN